MSVVPLFQSVPKGQRECHAEGNMKSGYLLLYRSIDKLPFRDHKERFSLWMRLLTNCNHGQSKKQFNGSTVTLTAGQVLTSYSALAKLEKCNPQTVRRSIAAFEKLGMISKFSKIGDKGYLLISLLNWSEYQQKTSEKADISSDSSSDTSTDISQASAGKALEVVADISSDSSSDTSTDNTLSNVLSNDLNKDHIKSDFAKSDDSFCKENKPKQSEVFTAPENDKSPFEKSFDAIWKSYPNKNGGKAKAKEQWRRRIAKLAIVELRALLTTVIADIKIKREDSESGKNDFIGSQSQHCLRYIRDERWLDTEHLRGVKQ